MQVRWSAILIIGALATRAEADKDAEQLFRDGRVALKAHKLDEACDMFARSFEIEPSITTLLNLGDCHEQAGRTASAWDAFVRAGALAREGSDPKRAIEAERRAKALEGKLGKLTLVVPASTPKGFAIKRCGAAIDQAKWNVALAVDAGPCRIEATAPGRQTWTGAVNVEDGKQAMLLVEIPAVDPNAPQAPGPSKPPVMTLGTESPFAIGVLVGAGDRENLLVGVRTLYTIAVPKGQVRLIANAFYTDYVDFRSESDMVELHTRNLEVALGAEYILFPVERVGFGGGLGFAADFDFPDQTNRARYPEAAGGNDTGAGVLVRVSGVLRLSRRFESSIEIQMLKNTDERIYSGFATLDWFP